MTGDGDRDGDGLEVRLFGGGGGPTTAHLVGELDLCSADDVDPELGLDGTALHLDLSGVTFMDVRGAAAIERVARNARAADIRVTVSGLSDAQARLFSLLGVDDLWSEE
jgi:anti-anti-sigma regulatory factor